jgi:hypothetical protein
MQKLLEELIERERADPISGHDIKQLLHGKVNVIRNLDLDQYMHIDELLYPYDQCVILYEIRPGFGHWVCLTKYGNSLEFFCSYGTKPDKNLKYIDPDFLIESGQDKMLLTQLLLNSDYDLTYNEFKFQERDPLIATCGKWAVLRCLLKEASLETFKNIFFGPNSDEIATFLCLDNKILGH